MFPKVVLHGSMYVCVCLCSNGRTITSGWFNVNTPRFIVLSQRKAKSIVHNGIFHCIS